MAADRSSPSIPSADSRGKSADEGRKRLGKYELERRIGAGGMGSVYLARDTQLRRTVALKILPREKANNPLLVRRFHSEAQAAAQLRHDNIVTVYEAGEAEGYLYMALEYVAGTDVHALVAREGPLDVARSLEIVKQAARALRHAWERGIVHRDIKPSNLLVSEDGIVKLTDMGLARSVDESMESGITRAGTTVGTVDYMAPEQGRDSKAADIRSDIYSLGCTWYQMLTGSPPFPGGSLTNKLFAHSTRPRPDPRAVRPEIPAAIVQVLHRMMARAPGSRYQTPEELLDDLERIDLAAESGQALPPGALEKLLAAPDEPDGSNEAIAARVADRFAAPRELAAARDARRLPPRTRANRFTSRAGLRRMMRSWALRAAGVAVVLLVIVGLAWRILARDNAPVEVRGGEADVAPVVTAPIDGAQRAVAAEKPAGDAASTARNAPPAAERAADAGERRADSASQGEIAPVPARVAVSSPQALGIGRAGEEPYLPAWIAGMLTVEQVRPPAEAKSIGLPVVRVGRVGDGPPGQFATLEEALDALPGSGGIVQLADDDVYALPARQMSDRGHIVLTSADRDARPAVVLRADHHGGKGDAIVALRNTSLTLAGIHVAFDVRQLPAGARTALFSLDRGDLAVRNCSISVAGSQPGEFTAFRLQGRKTRALLDRTLVWGERLTALAIEQPACDAVLWNCLAVAGDAPLLSLGDGPADVQAAGEGDASTPAAGRRVAILSSTLSSTRAAVRLTSAASDPPRTEIVAVNSILCGRRGNSPGVLADIEWPRVESPNRAGIRFRNLSWMSRGGLVAGFAELARWGEDADSVANGPSTWQRLWQSQVEPGQFRQAIWPREAVAVSGPADVAPFDRESFPGEPGNSTDGASPGCDIASLAVPGDAQVRRATALSRLPQPPGGFFDRSAPRLVIPVDLNRQDLGALLAARNWPSGTVVVATGRGSAASSPIHVRDKSLRIELSATGGDSLTLVPKPLNPRDIDPAAGAFDAFISVKGGSIEIVGGGLRLPSTAGPGIPGSILHVDDGSFLLRDCTLEGPILERGRRQALIRWIRSAGRSPTALDPVRGEYQHYAAIDGCYLIDDAKLFDLELRDRALCVRNSTLVAFDDLFAVSLAGNDPRIDGAIRIERSTLAAGRSFFDVATSLLSQLTSEPLSVFVEESVYLPVANADGSPGPVLLNCLESALRERQLDWWSERDAYALLRFRRFVGSPPDSEPQDFDAVWRGAWGAGQITNSLVGPQVVELPAPLTSIRRSQMNRAAFRPRAESAAGTWATDAGPLGDRR